MLLTITTTHQPATDLGYLLHKHPGRSQSFDLAFGQAHIFYPEATDDRCTAALMLDVDPIGLVRGRKDSYFALADYVNDRPYTSSSFLSVAMSKVFGTAMAGTCKTHPELAQTAIPLEAKIVALPCRGGADLLCRLFEPLGYTVTPERYTLDSKFPEWGESSYYTVTIAGKVKLSDLLSHLYVLIPVLDDKKHYYVGSDEVDKLLRHGEGWLSTHPERKLIADRYLKHRAGLVRSALDQLEAEEAPDESEVEEKQDAEEEAVEQLAVEHPISLNEQRLNAVVETLKAHGVKRVLDLGCGEGNLIRKLLEDRSFTEIVGMDVSYRVLEIAQDRLRFDRMPPMQRQRVSLIQGSLMYRDARLSGFDGAAVVEVIEHLDPPRLAAFERVVFEFARPGVVVITTPNAEYNVRFETLPAGKFRHRDHRFEWTRAQFREWAKRVAAGHGYQVEFAPVGPVDDEVGSPTQMAVFMIGQVEHGS